MGIIQSYLEAFIHLFKNTIFRDNYPKTETQYSHFLKTSYTDFERKNFLKPQPVMNRTKHICRKLSENFGSEVISIKQKINQPWRSNLSKQPVMISFNCLLNTFQFINYYLLINVILHLHTFQYIKNIITTSSQLGNPSIVPTKVHEAKVI